MISDILLILNRFLEINKTNIRFFKQMPKKLVLFICFAVPFLGATPVFFSINIEKSENGLFIKKLTKFGQSQSFTYFLLGTFAFETVLPILIVAVLGTASILRYRSYMSEHGRLTESQAATKVSENRLTRYVLILAIFCIVSRLLDLVSTVFFRLTFIDETMFSERSLVFIQLSVNLTNCCLYVVQALDCLVIFKMDKNVGRIISKMFKCSQVCLLFVFRCNFQVPKLTEPLAWGNPIKNYFLIT